MHAKDGIARLRMETKPAVLGDGYRYPIRTHMLALDDPRWSELWHCYGSGENVPPLLRRIERAKKDLPDKYWDEFSNILCHQCSTGSASVAAFPHLVRLAEVKQGTENGFRSLDLASLVLAFELGQSNQLNREWKRSLLPHPEYVLQPFKDAIKTGQQLVAQLLFKKRYSYNRMVQLLGIAGAFGKHSQVRLLIPQLQNHTITCPACEEYVDTRQMYTY
ncbi:hypothetical protein SH528x_003431 [Novipirellula sp. SH528]|uniref:hypothetical protein n=1 Tax=Novipirellula sp. SH528 TaxID=3454466 RepID=UPI003F9F66C3